VNSDFKKWPEVWKYGLWSLYVEAKQERDGPDTEYTPYVAFCEHLGG
jgi:hypothetical protein